MKVFLSWSGPRSRRTAEALREWLPDVIQGVEPWMSKIDIGAGARWRQEVSSELEQSKFGVLCLTPENQLAPWILFEAGALAKTIPDTFVCPYLVGLSPAELKAGPLTEFQAKQANHAETWEMVVTINRALKDQKLDETRLRRVYEKFWPDLEGKLDTLPGENAATVPRKLEEMVEEILTVVRNMARGLAPSTTNVTVEGPIERLILETYLESLLGSKKPYSSSKGFGKALQNIAMNDFFATKSESHSDPDQSEDNIDEARAVTDVENPDLTNG